jgi:trigger factor
VDIEQFEKGKPFKFTAKVQVKPEVKLGQYKGIEIPNKDFSVNDEDVNKELEAMRQRHAELVVVEDGEAQNGDIVIIDFEGFIDGEAFEGGKAEKYNLELGSGVMIPGFEEQVVGMKKEEEKEIQVTFPGDYRVEELKGKNAVFKVKLHEIKRKKLPELDDEFAKDVSEFETLQEFKEDVRKHLEEDKQKEKERYRENYVIEKAAEAAEVEIPQVMIDHEVEHMLHDFANRLRLQGLTMDMYYQLSGQNEEQLKEQFKDDARKRVLNSLVLETIAKEEQITVSEEEMNEELEKMGKIYSKTADEMREILSRSGNLEGLERDLVVRKTVQLLLEHSKETSEVA